MSKTLPVERVGKVFHRFNDPEQAKFTILNVLQGIKWWKKIKIKIKITMKMKMKMKREIKIKNKFGKQKVVTEVLMSGFYLKEIA